MEIGLYLRTLQRGWWIIVLTMLVALGASLLVSFFTQPLYEVDSRFVVSPNAGIFNNSWDVVSSLDTLDRPSIINTYKEVLTSPSVYGKNADIQKMDPVTLANDYTINAVVVPGTNILTLTVVGPNPDQVLLLSQAVGSEALNYINKLYPVYVFSVLDKPELPTVPIQPKPLQNAALSLLLGGIIGIVLAFSKEQLSSTIENLRERSIIDTASSAYTRAYFERRLVEEIAQRPDVSLSLGLVNFRGIAEVADVLPQPMMDRLINIVTQTLKNELRGRDIVGRWAHQQLIVLLPSTPSSAVEATFRRIQMYLAEPVLLDAAGDIVVRPDPCIGIVTRDQLETDQEVIKRVESAMERASALENAAVIFLSKPFVFADSEETI